MILDKHHYRKIYLNGHNEDRPEDSIWRVVCAVREESRRMERNELNDANAQALAWDSAARKAEWEWNEAEDRITILRARETEAKWVIEHTRDALYDNTRSEYLARREAWLKSVDAPAPDPKPGKPPTSSSMDHLRSLEMLRELHEDLKVEFVLLQAIASKEHIRDTLRQLAEANATIERLRGLLICADIHEMRHHKSCGSSIRVNGDLLSCDCYLSTIHAELDGGPRCE